jgi:hypothetical protein
MARSKNKQKRQRLKFKIARVKKQERKKVLHLTAKSVKKSSAVKK